VNVVVIGFMVMLYERKIVHHVHVHNVELYDVIKCLEDANVNLVLQVLHVMFV
jgi:hypothetical protein